jgi:hypothetical protein
MVGMRLNLADELLLLVYDDAGAPRAGKQAVEYGLAGALLMELMLAGRLAVPDQRVVVTDPSPTGDPLTDQALARIAADRRGRRPKGWIDPLSNGLRDRALDRLVQAGLLRREADRVLWVFPRTRFPSASGSEPLPEGETRRRLLAAVDATGPVDQRTAALCALVRAIGIERLAVPDRPKRQVQDRFQVIAPASWPADAVRRAITDAEAAAAAAVATATSTTIITS